MALEYDLLLPGGLVLEGHPDAVDQGGILLQDVQGLDGVGLRESATPVPDGDGEVPGPVRREARVLTVDVLIVGADRADLRARERALRAAVRPTSDTWPLRVVGRVGAPDVECMVRSSQRFVCPDHMDHHARVKPAQITLRAPDPRLYGLDFLTATVRPPEPAGGLEYPVEFPVDFAGTSYGGQTVTNQGDDDTWPVLTIYGPILDPVLRNFTTGQQITLAGTLASGDTLVIDPLRRTVTTGAGVSAYAWVDRSSTEWWPLAPGPNLIGIEGTDDITSETRLGLTWRTAWL